MEKNFNFKDIINAVERYWQENEFDFKKNEKPLVIFLAGQSASGKGQLKNEIDNIIQTILNFIRNMEKKVHDIHMILQVKLQMNLLKKVLI